LGNFGLEKELYTVYKLTGHFWKSNMTNAESPQQTATLTIEQSLQQAIAYQQAGQLQEAGELYLAILKTDPNHPEANHNMGVLAVQMKQPAAGLPYFMAALDADPARGQYWLNYIDALFQAGQLEDARQVLALAQQQGLQGGEVEAMAARLEGGAQAAEQPNAEHQHASKESLPVSPAAPQNSQEKAKTKPAKPNKSAGKSAPHNGKTPSPQEINTLVALFGQGRYTEVAALAQTMTERYPRQGVGWKVLGIVLQQMGRGADALVPMQKAAALLPGDADAHNTLGITLQSLGRLDEAEASYRRALKIKPDNAQMHNNLGATLQDMGRVDAAEASYRRALQLNPDYAQAHCNLGAALKKLGRLNEADASLRRALQINPNHAEAHYNLGITLMDMGRLDEAKISLQQALQINPGLADAHYNLGNTFKGQGRLGEAEASYRRALQIKPDDADLHNSLGGLLHALGKLNEAEACFRRALQIKPDDAGTLNNLGLNLQELGRLDEAEACFRQVLQTEPNNISILSNFSLTLQDLGRMDEAEACLRSALQTQPDYAMAHSNLLYFLTLNATMDPAALFSEHSRFGDQFEANFRANCPQFTNSRNPERCLQVGFVSGDLRNHAVANFLEPVLAHLSGYSQLSLHAYSNHVIEDAVTQRIQKYFAHWHSIVGLSDTALAEKIRADSIDVLIDLSGHTGKNRLLTFVCKPAPVQASWIGYPGTTGLSAMDYYLADRFLMPPGQLDDQFTEKIVRLPANAPFLPFEFTSSVNTLPALSNGYVTFGSFNRPNKLNRPVIALWSQLLRALPDSRMLLGGMPRDGKYGTLIEWFAQEGIARERLSFHARSGMDRYLDLHRQVDICLDTFPYNGGTTTLHALWMGIPTLTLAGDTLPGRVGAGILGHVGLEEFVAHDAADFVQRGLSWAGDLAALTDIRAGTRGRLSKSAMGQSAVVAAGVERALRIMWQRWCAGLPPESFEVSSQNIDVMTQEAGK
jgi:predicted O-linked N-acetylglucosamine transferase (SPINDLY family)